jgi:hypothetical protein
MRKGMFQLLFGAPKKATRPAFSIEHLYSSALFPPTYVNVTLYTLQLQKEVDSAAITGTKFY